MNYARMTYKIVHLVIEIMKCMLQQNENDFLTLDIFEPDFFQGQSIEVILLYRLNNLRLGRTYV